MDIKGIVFFGDSILAGTGASQRENGCAKLVKESLFIPVSLKGRNWNTSVDALNRLELDVLKQNQFSHIFILFGNNDCWLKQPNMSNVSIEQFESNIKMIIGRIKLNHQIPVLINLQPIDVKRFTRIFPELIEFEKKSKTNICALQKNYSDKLIETANCENIAYIDIRTVLENANCDVLAFDGIHLNDEGHKIIAKEIINYLKRLDNSLKVKEDLQMDEKS